MKFKFYRLIRQLHEQIAGAQTKEEVDKILSLNYFSYKDWNGVWLSEDTVPGSQVGYVISTFMVHHHDYAVSELVLIVTMNSWKPGAYEKSNRYRTVLKRTTK